MGRLRRQLLSGQSTREGSHKGHLASCLQAGVTPSSFALLRLGEVRFYSTLNPMGRMLTSCVEQSAFMYY